MQGSYHTALMDSYITWTAYQDEETESMWVSGQKEHQVDEEVYM